jgi:hypothetical protein
LWADENFVQLHKTIMPFNLSGLPTDVSVLDRLNFLLRSQLEIVDICGMSINEVGNVYETYYANMIQLKRGADGEISMVSQEVVTDGKVIVT